MNRKWKLQKEKKKQKKKLYLVLKQVYVCAIVLSLFKLLSFFFLVSSLPSSMREEAPILFMILLLKTVRHPMLHFHTLSSQWPTYGPYRTVHLQSLAHSVHVYIHTCSSHTHTTCSASWSRIENIQDTACVTAIW